MDVISFKVRRFHFVAVENPVFFLREQGQRLLTLEWAFKMATEDLEGRIFRAMKSRL